MIEHPTWRSLIYRLAEEYPDCLMLNFTIKVYRFACFHFYAFVIFSAFSKSLSFLQLISDAGFQAEITSISTAAQQMEVFSSVLKTSITNFLQASHEEQQKYIEECAVSAQSNSNNLKWSAGLIS